MKPSIKFGLIVGAVGLIFMLPISALMGICGPGVTLIAAVIAGFLSTYKSPAPTNGGNAQSGAIAGVITGFILLLGQLIANIATLIFFEVSRIPTPMGQTPSLSDPLAAQAIYYVSGLFAGLCLGILGLILGAASGAAGGILGGRKSSHVLPE